MGAFVAAPVSRINRLVQKSERRRSRFARPFNPVAGLGTAPTALWAGWSEGAEAGRFGGDLFGFDALKRKTAGLLEGRTGGSAYGS